MSTICPCCGSEVAESRLLVDLNTNNVSLAGKIVHTTPQLAELLFILNRNSPKLVPRKQMIAELYGLNEPKDPEGALHVQIHAARVVGRSVGFKIDNNHGKGYRLSLV